MKTLESKSVVSSAMIIIVAILVSLVPQLESVQTELLSLLTTVCLALIAGHKGKDIMLAKYADSPSAPAATAAE